MIARKCNESQKVYRKRQRGEKDLQKLMMRWGKILWMDGCTCILNIIRAVISPIIAIVVYILLT